MTGKEIGTPKATGVEELRARVQQRYEAVPFEHPNYPDIAFEVSILNNGEKEHINAVAEMGQTGQSGWVFNRMSVAYGLVTPALIEPTQPGATRQAREARAVRIADALKDYPDDFILPLAEEVWRLTNDYRAQREEGSNSPPFLKRASFLSSGSSTEPASPPTPSRGGDRSG
jgi:hypothetical protein